MQKSTYLNIMKEHLSLNMLRFLWVLWVRCMRDWNDHLKILEESWRSFWLGWSCPGQAGSWRSSCQWQPFYFGSFRRQVCIVRLIAAEHLHVNYFRSISFELWVCRSRILGNLSITQAIASFLHLAFVCNLQYPKVIQYFRSYLLDMVTMIQECQTLADIWQRRFGLYGDYSGKSG